MGKGIAALSYLPAIRITANDGSGSEFAVESFKAALNKIARLQEQGLVAASITAVPCLMNNPFSKTTWDFDILQTAGASATGTVTAATAIATNTVTVNGLLYTAVAGAKADNTEFSIDTGDNETAADLADSISNDTRVGTLNDVTAVSASAVVTITSSVPGAASNAITLASSGATLAVSGATLSGGIDPIDVDVEFDSEEISSIATIGRPALATRRLIDISLKTENNYAVTVRSVLAAVAAVEKFEDKVASTGSGAAGDGTFLNHPVKGNTPFETFTWDIIKSGNDYTLTPTANS